MNNKRIFYALTILLFILVFLLSACGQNNTKGAKPSSDWSRSLAVGENANGSIGLAIDETNRIVHLVWPFENGSDAGITYIQLAEDAKILLRREFYFQGKVKFPRLVDAGEGRQHFFWASRQTGEMNWTLYHSISGPGSDLTFAPKRLSPIGTNVGKFVVASDNEGGALVAWDQSKLGKIFLLHLGADGEPLSEPRIISSRAERPSLRIGLNKNVYLAWRADKKFFYTSLPIDDFSNFKMNEIVDHTKWGTLGSLGDKLDGPELGFANGWVYLFWTILSLTDTEAGTAAFEYVAFPDDSPAEQQPTRIWTISAEDQPYLAYDGGLPFNQLGLAMDISSAAEQFGTLQEYMSEIAGDWVNVSGAISEFMMNPAAMTGQADELAVAMVMNQEYRNNSHLQVATLVFSNGQYIGYSIASKTTANSDDPILNIDDRGDLHLAWREGPHGQAIYYATTHPKTMAVLDRLDLRDFSYAAIQGAMDGLASIAFVPFVGFGWILPGMILLGIWKLIKDQETIREPTSWVLLFLAILIFYAVKFVTLPTISTYTPFSAWLPIHGPLEPTLRLLIPLTILGLALYIANRRRLQGTNSTLIFYITFALVDATLTLAIYGVNFLGAI